VNDWLIYKGTGAPHDDIDERLPPPPSWRTFRGQPLVPPPSSPDDSLERRIGELSKATAYRASDEEIELVNAALYLRRPLLVTGKPGTGKSTLAYSVTHELNMGKVLKWAITSRSAREDGLYQYDALARLQDASRADNASRFRHSAVETPRDAAEAAIDGDHENDRDIGRYIRLGPLGTALLPYKRPRILLIDELDKSDIDLPNDLLTTFEDGQFEIRELSRIADHLPEASVVTYDGDRVMIHRGKVECKSFPLVIITSNGERDFPPAFLRRCLRLHIEVPDKKRLLEIVRAHLGEEQAEQSEKLVDTFISRRRHGDLATDQLLNAIYLMFNQAWPEGRDSLIEKVLQYLGQSTD
jgi:MoxR-like ATPase